jgi:hypothetical protein
MCLSETLGQNEVLACSVYNYVSPCKNTYNKRKWFNSEMKIENNLLENNVPVRLLFMY